MIGGLGRDTLVGRRAEQLKLTELVDRVRGGGSAVLVLRGEAGIGKTALLLDVRDQAADVRVITLSGAESELELTYAGIQQLCSPLLGHIDRLPEPQKNALRVALGLRDGAAPDRLLVGLAVLSLISDAAAERPTICIIDDAQWVDHASLQALVFAARRLSAEPVMMIFAARSVHGQPELSALPELHLAGLCDTDARALLSTILPTRLDESVRENILAEADGNPLALLELSRALPPSRLAGGYGLASAKPLETRIEQTYGRRLAELPSQTRTLLLIAAAEPTGEPTWLWAAAGRLGIGADAGIPAEQSGLVTVDTRMRFRHPLVRSAVYGGADSSERRQVHAALAEVIPGAVAQEHRVWHRAHAADGPDEAVARDLARSAEQASRRGGTAAAAAFLAHAAELTPDPVRRAERALAAALSKLDAGDPAAAARILAAVPGTESELFSARVDLVRAKIAFAARRGRDAPPLLLTAAEKLRPIDAALARDAYLEALVAAMIVGRLHADPAGSADAIAAAARQLPPPSEPASADLLLDGLVVRLTKGHAAAAPLLGGAISKYLAEDAAGTADPRSHDITLRVLLDLFDQDTYNYLNARQLELLRNAGELTVLPAALTTYAGSCVTAGDFAQAQDLLEQSDAISAATGAPPHNSIKTYLAACRGQEQLARQLAQTTISEASERGEGSEITVVLFALAVLHNGLAQYDEAFTACATALEYDDVGMYGHLLNEMVEAAARSGEAHAAAAAAAQLMDRAEATDTATARGYAARAKALTSVGNAAEQQYRLAISELDGSPLKVLTARTHLLFGEWLRRENRRAEARTELRTALEMFLQMGADGFTERNRRELTAAGEPLEQRRPDTSTATLTTQESYIARLAGDGYTNAEIASHLFISPRTVEWHMSKIFAKLGVSSRRELRRHRR
ncbi:helix-turn-helix transcriptional regulator [Mycobacterium conspicuum]|jgi:DNA-binding CsgD family transcriptional regulator|uniref:Helix-turn-helix transcriptional regulator n=1 Tax=Mycobacterium conspicuum TaxID=44010 RepID=A0A1X1T105_9MYCO|nr:LuxR family transcriptional regulator [Mycobacterium conspicuum]ORV37881.1 transcriptional regulator [Mycobacterium conspicuum]BBZ41348.1 helix-turn-helix transcriptional regulator [Mycobacterium conspicuum]